MKNCNATLSGVGPNKCLDRNHMVKNPVQRHIDKMLLDMDGGFNPTTIKTSYHFKKELGSEYRGLKVRYSIHCPQKSIYITDDTN